MTGLLARVRELIALAAQEYEGTPHAARLRAVVAELDQPLRVAIVGMSNVGKSTLLNALLGERIAATDATECTRVPTWYMKGVSPLAWAQPRAGERAQLPYERVDGATHIDLAGYDPSDLERLVVETPNSALADVIFIDTPGTTSAERNDDSAAGPAHLDDGAPDAVLYLLRRLHVADVDFLEAFRGQGAGNIRPVSAIAVLSRCDELGNGRFDALDVGTVIADGLRHEHRLRGLVQTVVPVAGLLAETAATLRESEFLQLTALAAAPVRDTCNWLGSADRFAQARSADAGLLIRLGLFGLRYAVELIRRGVVTDSSSLARELRTASGVPALREMLRSRIEQRSGVLKAVHALAVLDAVLAERVVAGAQELAVVVEELLATAHDLAEVRLLNDLFAADIAIDDDVRSRLRRILGGDGTSAVDRLGTLEVADAARIELGFWRAQARGPLSTPALRRAATVAARTCERLIVQAGAR